MTGEPIAAEAGMTKLPDEFKTAHTTTPWKAVIETKRWDGEAQRPFLDGVIGPDGERVVLAAFTLSSGRYPDADVAAANSMFVVRTVNAHEELRRQLAAMLFFAIPPKDAPEDEKFDRLTNPIRGLLHCIDIIDGKSDPDTSMCEGCEKVLTPEMPRLVCDDGPELCIECMPEEARASPSYGYCAEDADRDIARARRFVADLMHEPEEAAS